jgi:arsenate reductase-like glutaredoxin family protein
MTETLTASAVTLFVVPNCPLCAHARAWLARHEISFVERDVQRDFGALRAMYRLTRQNLVPVFARGERALVRPSDEQLMEFLVNRK